MNLFFMNNNIREKFEVILWNLLKVNNGYYENLFFINFEV